MSFEERPPRPDLPPGREPEGGRPARPLAPPATWQPVEAIPVFFIALIGTFLGGAVALGALHSCGGRVVLQTLLGELAFAASVIFWIRYVNRGRLAALGAPTSVWRDLALGLGVGVVLIVAGGMTLLLVRLLVTAITGHTPATPSQVAGCVRGTALGLLGPVVILVAPLGEETFFRGFLYKGLRRRMAVWPAALLSAAVFGLVHFFPLLIPALFVVGIGLALVYEQRQSLLASMAAHATFNLIGFITIALARR